MKETATAKFIAIFRVKKSSQSRKLMKQIRAERKQRERQDLNPEPTPPPLPPGVYSFSNSFSTVDRRSVTDK